ncbi:MAG: hypothetical protein PWQ91_196 [Eubacteriales bacterium]|nr:hypothetical protein [Eubacteriales bacterium]MDN5363135.1 hypothetical protein [Eubacteriales bacterium]
MAANLTGVNLTDQVICGDLLSSVKSSIKTCASAITEATSPEVRNVLRRQLEDAITFHEKVSEYMMEKGWYHPYDINEQIKLDLKGAQSALNL